MNEKYVHLLLLSLLFYYCYYCYAATFPQQIRLGSMWTLGENVGESNQQRRLRHDDSYALASYIYIIYI